MHVKSIFSNYLFLYFLDVICIFIFTLLEYIIQGKHRESGIIFIIALDKTI